MTDRLPDHVGMFDTAVFELSTARGSSHSYIRHATREIPPEIQSQAGTGGVPPEIILAAEGQGDRATDIEGLVKGIVMEPANYVGVPHWDQIVGNDDAKTLLWSHIITRRSFKQYFEEPASILLFGPPGTGKTSMVKSLARHAGFVCLEINGPMIKKKYFGETEA